MARILITGGGGYIGTMLVPYLLDRGHEVRVVDRFFFGRELLGEHERLDLVREDVRRLPAALLAGVDQVIDLAAVSNDPSGEAFQQATWQINHEARVRTAKLARAAGVARYVLVSSTSVYGFRDSSVVVDETSEPNPLTTYARANLRAEKEILPLAGDGFAAMVVRLATVFGASPRMRFDLAINGMTFGAWKTGRLPLLRDGLQWRPLVHVEDVASALHFLLNEAPVARVSGGIFNVGDNGQNHQLRPLAEMVAGVVPGDVEIEWYGEPDHRSYRVSFDRIGALGWGAVRDAEHGVREIVEALAERGLERDSRSITLEWYREIDRWRRFVRETELHGGMLDIEEQGRT